MMMLKHKEGKRGIVHYGSEHYKQNKIKSKSMYKVTILMIGRFEVHAHSTKIKFTTIASNDSKATRIRWKMSQ